MRLVYLHLSPQTIPAAAHVHWFFQLRIQHPHLERACRWPQDLWYHPSPQSRKDLLFLGRTALGNLHLMPPSVSSPTLQNPPPLLVRLRGTPWPAWSRGRAVCCGTGSPVPSQLHLRPSPSPLLTPPSSPPQPSQWLPPTQEWDARRRRGLAIGGASPVPPQLQHSTAAHITSPSPRSPPAWR